MTIVVDAQIHIWARIQPDAPGTDVTAAERHVPLSAPAAIDAMDVAGVTAAVVVPPTFAGEPNELAVEAARAYPDRLAVMGRLDVADPRSRARLAAWRQPPEMLGVRLTFSRGGAGRLTDGTADWFWPAAERLSLPVMIGAPGRIRIVSAILAAHPGLRVAVDHLGLPDGCTEDDLDAAVATLAGLAAYQNFAVKASALPRFSREPYPHADVARAVRRLVDSLGPARVFWGSDFTRVNTRYADDVRYLADSGLFTPAELDAVMGAGLCGWLGWQAPLSRAAGTANSPLTARPAAPNMPKQAD